MPDIDDLIGYTSARIIVRQAPAQDYRISSIILGVVNSQPFQMRKSR